MEVASLSCSSQAVSKLAAGIDTPSNPNFVVQSITPSFMIKWIRSKARLIWQKTVSRFSRAEGDSECLWKCSCDYPVGKLVGNPVGNPVGKPPETPIIPC